MARALPETAHGVRVSGDPDRVVRRVAVCGGAGDFLLDAVRGTDADVYVTSDLRHHPASEFLEHGGPALVDVAHWAAEWTWLPVLQAKLVEALGGTVESRVSTLCTDPWNFRTEGADAESRPVRPTEAARRPGARLPADRLRHQRANLPELAEIADAGRTEPSSRAGAATRRSSSTT